MATKTTNYEFLKPDADDEISPEQYNSNFDTLDEKLKSVEDSLKEVSEKVGNTDTTLSDVDTKLEEVDEKLTEHDTAFSEINETIKDIDTTPRNLATIADVLKVLGTVNEPIEPTEPDTPSTPDTPDTPDTESANVFGVMWDSSKSSTALTRLTKDTDPYKLVTQNVTTEPVPAVGTGAGSSPFDNFAPWSGMKRCGLNLDGSVWAWDDEEKFFYEHSYTMVFIPAFWFSSKTDGTKKYFYISDKETDGFAKHPGSGKYVGRYVANQYFISTSGKTPQCNITRAAARTGTTGNGEKFHLYDFATHCAIVLLHLVEYADWNCQAKIGKGRCKADSVANTGETDSMTYHTGTTTSKDSTTDSVQYRWIENPWGNVNQLVDGFNVQDGVAYYCLEPAKYADNTTDGYTEIGALPNSNFIKNVSVTDNGLIIPSETSSAETYISDWAQIVKSGAAGLYVGGSRTDDTGAGLMFFNVTPYTGATVSARLECEP